MVGVCKCDASERVLDDVIFAASGAERHTKPGQLFHRHALEVGHNRKRSATSGFLDLFDQYGFFRPVLHGDTPHVWWGFAFCGMPSQRICLSRMIKACAPCLLRPEIPSLA